MNDRKFSRERAKAALKELKKNKRLPKNYPLSAYYQLHLMQEKGERMLADTRRQVSAREQLIKGVTASADSSFEVSLLEIEEDLDTESGQAQSESAAQSNSEESAAVAAE
jgi:DNA invertase Pin-like site-specific DNA recombinase